MNFSILFLETYKYIHRYPYYYTYILFFSKQNILPLVIKKVITVTSYTIFFLKPVLCRQRLRKQIYVLHHRENNPTITIYSLDTLQGIHIVCNNESSSIKKQTLSGHSYELFNTSSTFTSRIWRRSTTFFGFQNLKHQITQIFNKKMFIRSQAI